MQSSATPVAIGNTGCGFPLRLVRHHLEAGRLWRVPHVPQFKLPAWMVFPRDSASEILPLVGLDWNDHRAALFTIASLALSLLGYPLDTRFDRRLPWWAKLAIPGVGGVLAGVALAATPHSLTFAALSLVASVGIAWLIMRRR